MSRSDDFVNALMASRAKSPTMAHGKGMTSKSKSKGAMPKGLKHGRAGPKKKDGGHDSHPANTYR